MVGLQKKESVEVNLNLHTKTILHWCENSGRQIAKEKTEIILLTRMRVPKKYNITLTGEVLNTRKRVKYLGVVLDSNRNYCGHFDGVCNRANAIVGATRGLLLNMNGLSHAYRKLYCQVWESVVLYVSPVWVDVLSTIKTVGKLCRVQRGALISTSTAYRTVSHAALCVLTGTMPIHIRAQ